MTSDVAGPMLLWLWLFVGGAGGYLIGHKARGRGPAGALLGALAGCLGWLLVLVFFEDHRTMCPECRSIVDPRASVCRFCQARFVD